MGIRKYLDLLGVKGKKFALLSLSPTDMYPEKYGEKFELFVQNVLSDEEKFIPLIDNERKEIVQDVAFKLFTMPIIADSNDLLNSRLKMRQRANQEKVKAFIVLKVFYENVPSGKLKEDEAIKQGIEAAEQFIIKYPLNKHDVVITIEDRHEYSVGILNDIDFECKNGYYFDFRYCY